MINSDKHREEESFVPVDRNKPAVGNSAKHGSLNSSGREEDASSKNKKDKICIFLTDQIKNATTRPC